jgi:hypothetical protein
MATPLAPRTVLVAVVTAFFAVALLYGFHLERKLRAICEAVARVEAAEARFYTNYPDLAADRQLRAERGRIRDTCAGITWEAAEQPPPRE